MSPKIRLLVLICLVVFPVRVEAVPAAGPDLVSVDCNLIIDNAELYVDAVNGDNSTGDGSLATPWKTITYALESITNCTASAVGIRVHVAEGTYNTALGETFPITIIDGVSLVGAGAGTCILDAQGTAAGSVIFCEDIGTGETIDGFTVTGGKGTNIPNRGILGGGILCIESSPSITNCTITGNGNTTTPTTRGGGIALLNNASPTISKCTISGNSAGSTGSDGGGGIYMKNKCSPTIDNCIIEENYGGLDGGGLFILDTSSPYINNCLIVKNVVERWGSAMDIRDSYPIITNSTITENSTETIFGFGAIYMRMSSLKIINSILWGNLNKREYGKEINVGINYNDGNYPVLLHTLIGDDWFVDKGEGNINADPMFADAANGDYRLQAGSPAVDLGVSNDYSLHESLDGIPRPQGAGYDAGAYELTQCTSADAYYLDNDGDGFGDPNISECVSTPPGPEYILIGGDCNDSDNSIHPGAEEFIGNDIDENCDGHKGLTLEVGPSTYPYTSIQAAIDDAVKGDEILVHDGTYYENISFMGREITVRSENGAKTTIIDGGNEGTGVSFNFYEDSNSILDGFTIQHGDSGSSGGGGITCNVGTLPIITDCIISQNTSGYEGGGVYLDRSSAKIINCVISENKAQYGGGILANAGSPTFINCLIKGNNATQYGGGIKMGNTPVLMVNCSIIENYAEIYGSAIRAGKTSAATITNSIIWGNNYTRASSSQAHPFISMQPADNRGINITHSIVEGGWTEDGNIIDAAPKFLRPGQGDYHLQADSPALDAGTDVGGLIDSDIEGTTRSHGTNYDIGPYEHVPCTTANTYYRDADRDGLGNPDIFVNTCNSIPPEGFAADNSDSTDYQEVGVEGYLFTSIQAAIDDAVNGDEVMVHDGRYFDNISFRGKEIIVRSVNGPSKTIIDGRSRMNPLLFGPYTGGVGVAFLHGEDERSVLDGFSIQNSMGIYGGGLHIHRSSPVITNCNIAGNDGESLGGGAYLKFSSAVISNCIIAGNTAGTAAGLYISESSPTIANCTIADNAADSVSGGVGGILPDTYTLVMVNNILWGNTVAGDPGEIDVSIYDSIDISYSDIQGGHDGTGNIDQDPLFLDPRPALDTPTTAGYYYIKSGSPCIDTAGPASAPPDDIEGEARPQDGNDDGIARYDMGADEYIPCADRDDDGYSYEEGCGTPADCDDTDANINPGAAEVCDGLDNDCDGIVDSITRPTTCGLGECAGNIGQESCTAGEWGGDTCDPYAGMIAEICDTLDNDCDGETDEELGTTTCGLGVCGHTVNNCQNGIPQPCDPFEGSSTEVCNDGEDNDCDGDIDEGCTCTPSEEVCDGVDNNCDGVVDEGCSTVPGDVDGDGNITPKDALMAFRHYLGTVVLDPSQQVIADVNNDNSVTPADALCIYRKYLGLPSCLDG